MVMTWPGTASIFLADGFGNALGEGFAKSMIQRGDA
jgi:hypothetical protein